jgi:transcriptional regulator with XRE-family HTH domain
MPRPRHIDKNLQKEVGARLAVARKARGWSQERLAEALSVQPETISRYETGAVPMSLAVLVRVTDALQVAVTTMLPEASGVAGHDDELQRVWQLLDDEARQALLLLMRRAITPR